MKKSILLFFFVAITTLTTFSQDFSVVAGSMYRSHYVGPDGLTFYSKPVIQSNVTLTHKSGIYFDLWTSTGLNTNWSSDWDDEFDYTIGWTGNLSKQIHMATSLTYFDDFDIFRGPFNDVLMGKVSLDMTKEISKSFSLNPFIEYSTYLIPDKKTPFGGGSIYGIGTNSKIAITKVLTATPSGKISYDNGAFDVGPGLFVNLYGTLSLELSDHATWNVAEITAFFPVGTRDLVKNEFVFGTGLAFSF